MSEKSVRGGNCRVRFMDGIAIKELINTKEGRKERFKQEIRVVQDLNRRKIPHIVEIIKVDINEKSPSKSTITMKKYQGDLEALASLTKGKVLYSLRLMFPIIETLKLLSEMNPAIYHRDLKPANILYEEKDGDYELVLTDFGACYLKDDNSRITEDWEAVGARVFIAPEYELGKVDNVTEKGDVFSLGKIIWYLINGEKDALLPGNYWFDDMFDLSKKFPNDPLMYAANVIISSCLKIKQEERCTYEELITMIKNIISKEVDLEKMKIEQSIVAKEEKLILKNKEIENQNILLVNEFSRVLVEALSVVNRRFPSVTIIENLLMRYKAKSKDGISYITENVLSNSYHYLLDMTYEGVCIDISYNPNFDESLYANITFSYNIFNNKINDTIRVFYNNSCLYCEYNTKVELFNTNIMIEYLIDFINNRYEDM